MREGYCSCPVCVSVHGSNLLVAQLRDKLVILTGSVSWSRFSYNGFVSKIGIAFPYYELTVYSRPFLYAKRAHFPHSSVYYARDFTRAVNLYAHV